jgi:hypothetical protein
MRYLPRNLGELHTVPHRLLRDEMLVEASEETGITAKSVGDLRRLSSWPGGLVVDTPLHPDRPEGIVKISMASRH